MVAVNKPDDNNGYNNVEEDTCDGQWSGVRVVAVAADLYSSLSSQHVGLVSRVGLVDQLDTSWGDPHQ